MVGWLILGLLVLWLVNEMSMPVAPTTAQATSPGIQAMAQAIAGAEGYGVPGAIPTTHNNPGDLTDGSGAIKSYPTPDAGWNALYAFLELIESGAQTPYSNVVTIQDFANVYTATQQTIWAVNVCLFLSSQGYPCTPDSDLLPILQVAD